MVEIYNEPDLNALEEQLNIDNQNIRESFENFMKRVHWCVRRGRNCSHGECRSGLHSLAAVFNLGQGHRDSESGKQSQVFSLPAEVSWEPDLWGKVRNTIHSAQYNARSPRPIWPMRS